MRFMMLILPKGYADAAPGAVPTDTEAVAAMMKYNQAMLDAGILITLDGLHPPSMGARVTCEGGQVSVMDGPFPEVREVLGGYWMINVKDLAEAKAWALRCPFAEDGVIEIRRVQEMEDFPEDVQAATADFAEHFDGASKG